MLRSREPTTPDLGAHADQQELVRLLEELTTLLARLPPAEQQWSRWLTAVAPENRVSARNLVHYWTIRQCDLRGVQKRLARYGLSSLGRSESHVEATLSLIQSTVTAMLGDGWRPPAPPAVRIDQGDELLRQRAQELLGPEPVNHPTRIMVTLPSEAATDAQLVAELIARGMNIARINCAHDDADAWRAMADHVRRAAQALSRPCLIAMDLGGPKLRTGPLTPGPKVAKLRPHKDALGEVIAPALAWLTAAEAPTDPPAGGMTVLPVPQAWLALRRGGEVIRLRDSRGAKRRLVLAQDQPNPAGGAVVTAAKTTYLTTGTRLRAEDATRVELGELPQTEQHLTLRHGDVLTLTRDCSPVRVQTPARIGCTLPELFDHARVGDRVHLDDGKISGQIVTSRPDTLSVRVDYPEGRESRLKAGKGINVPGTDLPIPAMTVKDIADLDTVVELADIVQMSFVRNPADVQMLLDELDRRGDDRIGIVLKVETRQAFEQLPRLVLTAMGRPRVGVMIARGDLAVECGYERLAELQEEILWLCEAAHLPVIWATQVLEQLASSGLPSRAEISDAAMSERAECVMLNKGPYINDAVLVIDNILERMSKHHYKKNALFPTLHSWRPE